MTPEDFEQLPVWKAAIALATHTCALTLQPPFLTRGGLRDQLERALVSISNQLAQGFERGNARELLACLSSARGAASETRSMLCLLEGLAGFEDFRTEIAALKAQSEALSRALRALSDSLRLASGSALLPARKKSRLPVGDDHEHDEFRDELRRIQKRFLPDCTEDD